MNDRPTVTRRALLGYTTGLLLAAIAARRLRWRPTRASCGLPLTRRVNADSNAASPASSAAPLSVWPGFSTSDSLQFSWCGPPTQTDWNWQKSLQYYKVYRDGVLICGPPATAKGVTPMVIGANGAHPQPWYCDRNLRPSAIHTYHVTCVDLAGVESPPSPSITMTTLAGSATPTTPPAAVPNPDTWIAPYALPAGGTLWTATNTANWDAAGSGNNNASGCGFRYALQHANVAGGDVIVLTAGAVYNTPPPGWRIPAFTGTAGWTYIISSEDPVYKSGGALIAYAPAKANVGFSSYSCSGNIPAGATSASLNGNWTLKTGHYWTLFDDVAGGGQQERLVLFTNGQRAIDWSHHNGSGAPGQPSPQLPNAVSATFHVIYTAGVTPADKPTMATLSYGKADRGCINIAAGCNKVRFVGINIEPGEAANQGVMSVGFTNSNYNSLQPGAEHIYFDRCMCGNDSLSASYRYVTRGFGAINCNHLLLNQCYAWGHSAAGGDPDSQAVWGIGGGPHCIQNCYLESHSQAVLYGGGYVERTQLPNNVTYRYNFAHKPAVWEGMLSADIYSTPATLSAASATNPIRFTTAAAPRGWKTGNRVLFSGLTGPWSALNNAIATMTVIDGTDFTVPVDGRAFGAFAGGTATKMVNQFLSPKPLLELKVGILFDCYGNLHLNNWTGSGQQGYHGAAFAVGAADQMVLAPIATNPQMLCPWVHCADVDIHDNLCMNVGTGLAAYTGGVGMSGYDARVRFANNMVLANCSYESDYSLRALRFGGPLSDLTVDHNTVMLNLDLKGKPVYPQPFDGIYSYPFGTSFSNPAAGDGRGGYTPNGFPDWQDRMTITNNIIGGHVAWHITVPGLKRSDWTNLRCTNNLTIGDSSPNLQDVVYAGVAHGSVGFANWQGYTKPPALARDWNVTSGRYAKASTSGGPLGATL